MNLVRIGRVVRTLRRNRGWRQRDLARRAICSQQAVSRVECGRRLSMATLERVAHALDAELELSIRWHGGQLERLLDEGHAELVALTARRLERDGWTVRLEVSYETARSSGSIDLLAYHDITSALLVVEVKTELLAGGSTLRRHDEKTRLGGSIGGRFGWHPTTISRLLVVPAATTARRALVRRADLFDRAYPLRSRAIAAWLRSPTGEIAGLLFMPITKPTGASRELASRRRVRARAEASAERAAGARASSERARSDIPRA